MKKLFCLVFFGLAALPAAAQMPMGQSDSGMSRGTQSEIQEQHTSGVQKDPLATYIRGQFNAVSKNVARSADIMPEEDYGMRPGTQMEVRTFGQLMGHVINVTYGLCAMAQGQKNPNATDFEKTEQTKASLQAAIKAANAYCQPAYDNATDAFLMEVVTNTMPNGKTLQVRRFDPLLHEVIHDNEEYGNMVGLFRVKNIVPPSSRPPGT